jgi:selenocysteine lyase/cysteine desulfurase
VLRRTLNAILMGARRWGRQTALVTRGQPGPGRKASAHPWHTGLCISEKVLDQVTASENERPVVFTTHMERRSNHMSWIESVAGVRVINATADGLMDLAHLATLLNDYRPRKMKIVAVTSCCNVTGILTPCDAIAGLMHRTGGLCFVDFAAN